MISFSEFEIEDGSPLYLQIIRYIKRGIIAGTIPDQEEMPSRRVLSALLGVNPNTVQKAYRLLEEDGLAESRTGAASFITVDEAKKQQIKAQLLEADLQSLVTAMRQMGVSRDEAVQLIEKAWGEPT
ncbi:MAG: GntR family transcriptional regulator [Clostridia bacterium]|nr:GntR family transcriptional regulator [Clostridia bacterium]